MLPLMTISNWLSGRRPNVKNNRALPFRSSINRLRRWFYNPKLFFWNVFQSSTMHDDVRLTQSMLLTTPQAWDTRKLNVARIRASLSRGRAARLRNTFFVT